MGHMNSTESKPFWKGSAQDLLNCYLAIDEFKLSNYVISQELLLQFDELLARHNAIPSDRLL